MAPIRKFVRRIWGAAEGSALFLFLDRLADDVGHVGGAFFLLLDEGCIVEALVAYLDFFLLACSARGIGGGRLLLALLFGLGVLERNKFGVEVSGTMVSDCATGAGRTGAAGSARARGGVGATMGTTLPVYGDNRRRMRKRSVPRKSLDC